MTAEHTMLGLFSEFNRLIETLSGADIEYAVVGALAVAIYGGARATGDIDILIPPGEQERVTQALQTRGYLAGTPWTFRDSGLTLVRFTRPIPDSEDFFLIDILLGKDQRFHDIVRGARREPWANGYVRVARVEDLIWMKSLRNSKVDQADIALLEDLDGTEKSD